MSLAFCLAPKMGQAESAMGASAENFSKSECDEINRLRRLSRLFSLPVRGAESDAGHGREAKPPVRRSDSDDSKHESVKIESKADRTEFLSWNMTVTLISPTLVSRFFSMLCRIFSCSSLVTFSHVDGRKQGEMS